MSDAMLKLTALFDRVNAMETETETETVPTWNEIYRTAEFQNIRSDIVWELTAQAAIHRNFPNVPAFIQTDRGIVKKTDYLFGFKNDEPTAPFIISIPNVKLTTEEITVSIPDRRTAVKNHNGNWNCRYAYSNGFQFKLDKVSETSFDNLTVLYAKKK